MQGNQIISGLKKGDAHTFTYGTWNCWQLVGGTNYFGDCDFSDASSQTITISKDNGSFVAVTNSPVKLFDGTYTLDITAEEMNADKIVIRAEIVTDSTKGINNDFLLVIYTNKSVASGDRVVFPDEALSTVTPTINEVLGFLYQYFRNRRNRSGWTLSNFLKKG